MAQPLDPYRALGVRHDATDIEIKAAHRKLAKRFHPDTAGGDRDRFLKVQEAYRLLSDPIARRDWDEQHAPGPMRADRSSAAPSAARPRGPRRPARPPKAEESEQGQAAGGTGAPDPAAPEPAARRPRSSRAYTWSASEVPWWEEGVSDNRRQPGRKRPARPSTSAARNAGSAGDDGAADASPPPPSEGANPFDVYNRSSGAAWSMAARAYFRRGDQELPRRGQFQYEGTQVLTGARARTYAEAEARRRAAEARREPQAPAANASGPGAFTYTAAGVSRDAHRIHEVRQRWQKRTSARTWPSLRERLFYALLAWVPAAIVIGYGGAAATGCDTSVAHCPAYVETSQALAIALVLGLLVAFPKIAYFGAMAAIGALLVGLVVAGAMAIAGVQLPLTPQWMALLASALGIAYLASVGLALLRNRTNRPWYTGLQP